ncbi:MAG: hypothetical protein A2W91_16150 [Bacteroidetes bacterium GWF2_38_335]|nr:MAG: hypothetical protein A2W91_16150 [Bacteroidetes bacterium GWF2_38_335]OFY81222.1 MAG: hypothetical protein A2281_07125 [Bacteroidetes bacterium RIFOXYA12_FULL_38_20]HBS85338.1 hypothetical protein [Bacteroidales bacterium]
MKKVYILFIALLIAGVSFAQYSSKQNAVKGIVNQKAQAKPVYNVKDVAVDYFTEGFEGADLAATGWTTNDADGDGQVWTIVAASPGPHSGTKNASSASWNSTPLTPNNWLISPQIDLTSASGTIFLKYFVAAQDPDWESEHYSVNVSTTGTAVANFTQVLDETLPVVGTSLTYFERSIDLSAYAGQQIYIAFRHYNCTDMFRINIDDVSVYQETTTDGAITGVTAPNNDSDCSLTAAEPVTITIFNNGGVALSGFQASYSINGGAPVTETVAATIAPAASYNYTFTATANLSALDYYDMVFDLNITGDANAANDGWTTEVRNTDGVIIFEVQSDATGDQEVFITNSAAEEVWYHGPYQWDLTTVDQICVLDDDCYTIEFNAGGSNTVIADYNGTEIYNEALTGSATIYAIGGNCAALDASLDALTFPGYTLPSTNVNITGTVQNVGSTNITSYSVSYTIDGGASVGTYNVTGVNIATGGTHDFTHNVPFNTATEDTYTIEVTVSNVNGATDENLSNNVLSKSLLVTSSLMQRLVVWEEFSTESCPNCPPVMDAMLAYEATQPNMVMMTHHSGYYTDFLTITESEDAGMMLFYNDGGGSYAPAGMCDRFYNGEDNDQDGTPEPGPVFWPGSGYGEAIIDAKVEEPAFVSVNLNGTYNASTNALNLTVSGSFLTDFTGTYGVSVWICQNNIQESASGQSGATYSPYIHQHAVRDVISTSMWGDQITTPTTAGSNYSKTYTFTGNAAWVDADLYLVAFVNKINASDINARDIQNAGTVEVLSIEPVGNSEVVAPGNIQMYPNPSNGTVNFMNVENSVISIYNMLGEVVYSTTSNNMFKSIDLSNLENGTYVARVSQNGNIVTKKVVINK